MTDRSQGGKVAEFAELWAESFRDVLGQVGVEAPATELLDAAAAAPERNAVWLRFGAEGALQGQQAWLAAPRCALQLAQVLLSEPLDAAAEFSETHRDAYAELLRQVAGQAVTCWKAQTSREVQFPFVSATAPESEPEARTALRIHGPKFPEITLVLTLDGALVKSLGVAQEPAASLAAPAESAAETAEAALPTNLNLLLDMELEATIRFGQREMTLRDVLGMMPGAVVELDRQISEPAEFLVAGRLVARGEVVVVDGNFGLRVTEVASPGQRAEILKG